MSIYHPIWFYLITIGATFALCPIAAYLSNHQPLQKFLFPLLLMTLSIPCITALSMIFGSKNEGLITDFVYRLTLFKISVPNLLFILLFMPCVIYLATGISVLFGYGPEQFGFTKEISAMKGWAVFGIVIPLVLAPLIEELGWRGYGVDSLRAHFNLFNASVLFGILWAIWHLPTFFVKGFYQNGLWNLGIVHVINFFVSVFVIAILMNWIYYKTDRSIPALVLFHAMLNFASMAFKTEPVTKCIATVILCVSAAFIVIYDKEYFFQNSRLEITSNRLQTVLDDLKAEYGFPGVTCAYVLSNGTVGEAASGLADKETLQPMTLQSRMLAASIGKSFVAATVIALAKEERLHLDDPLSKTLGQCSWFSRLPNHETITLRHLLTHSSGLPDHVHIQDAKQHMQDLQESLRSVGSVFSPELLIEFVLDQPPLFEAGRGWAYTDTGYILLGLVIEHVTQNSYAQELQERFLSPLHLDRTIVSDCPTLPGLVAGYTSPENSFGFAPKV